MFCACLCFSIYYFESFLVLQSSSRGRESWLLSFNVLLLWVFCDSFSWCHGMVFGVWLWYFQIILTYFLDVCRVQQHFVRKSYILFARACVYGTFHDVIMTSCSPQFHCIATWYRVVMVSVTHLPCDYSNLRSDSTELAKDIQMPYCLTLKFRISSHFVETITLQVFSSNLFSVTILIAKYYIFDPCTRVT